MAGRKGAQHAVENVRFIAVGIAVIRPLGRRALVVANDRHVDLEQRV